MTRQKVDVIPASVRSVQNGGQLKSQTNIRVAAYCRVSTGDESQQTSYTTQKAFYKDLITRKPGWIFAGIYADEAKSGTNREHREEFNRMIKDAMDGKLDYIVTKSISRFARNTIDSLTCTRELRQLKPPVGIYFEKENIDTLDAKGELILTILSALAQDESRSISDNIRWSIQKKFQSGVPHINLKRMLGYELGENKQWVIVPEQAEIIRYIFDRFVKGQTANKIAQELNQMEKFTVNGKKWSASSILIVLRNEKYVGDIEMQKTITKDMLHFEKGIYCAFVESGVLQGDVATYKTNFGVTLTSKGNRRTLDSFMGYKRSDMDGNVVYVDAPYKVYGFSIQYRRYLTTAAKREREEAV